MTSAVNVLYTVQGEENSISVGKCEKNDGQIEKKNALPVLLLRRWHNRSHVMLGSAPEESVFWQDDESKGEEPDGDTLFVLSV